MHRGAWHATVHRVTTVGHNWATNTFTFLFNQGRLYNRGNSTQYSVVLTVPWTARWDQSILKEINPEYSLAGLILKLKLQYFWLADAKSWLIGKDPDPGKDWGQGEKGMTEDELVGWHHWLNGHEFEQTLGNSEGWGSLACCSSCGRSQTWLSNWITTKYKEKILKKAREKQRVNYKGIPIRLSADFSTETL